DVGIRGIGMAQQPVEVRRAFLVADTLLLHPLAHDMQHLRLQILVHAPEDVIWHGAYLLEGRWRFQASRPAGPRKRSNASIHSFARNVGRCTPFVIAATGFSSAETSGQKPCASSEETRPWIRDTPL